MRININVYDIVYDFTESLIILIMIIMYYNYSMVNKFHCLVILSNLYLHTIIYIAMRHKTHFVNGSLYKIFCKGLPHNVVRYNHIYMQRYTYRLYVSVGRTSILCISPVHCEHGW